MRNPQRVDIRYRRIVLRFFLVVWTLHLGRGFYFEVTVATDVRIIQR